MYNVKGPSKMAAKTARRGIAQNIENYKDHNKVKIGEDENNCKLVPKPVFQKKMGSATIKHEYNMTPEHIELIKYINESWTSVCSELDQENGDAEENCMRHQHVYFYQDEPAEFLQDFKPFDLEAWWGKRLYAHITATSGE